MEFIIVILLMIVLVVLLFLLWHIFQKVPKGEEFARINTLNDQKDRQIEELKTRAQRVDELQSLNARLAADLDNERNNAQEKLRLLQESEARLKLEFENLANRIFEEKGRTFTDQNTEKLSGLLNPFREQIESFRKRVDEVHRDDTEGFAKLLEQVRQLQELNAKVSQEANNLAEAIKGDAKAQGNWGELIVEKILELSGLVRGDMYEMQQGFRAEDGMLQKPDFIVKLPGNKAVIIDSKVSLTAYDRYWNEPDEQLKQSALAEHLSSVRKHLEELSQKNYQHLLGNRTLDFVIMCVPIEPAFQLAMQSDQELLYDSGRLNVFLTGPATLMLTLKLIAQNWRRENENLNAEIIAKRAGLLYDQVALVYESMTEAKKKLGGVQESFDTAMNRLRDGKGNLVGRVEELRKLGAKTSKRIPQELAGNTDGQKLIENE